MAKRATSWHVVTMDYYIGGPYMSKAHAIRKCQLVASDGRKYATLVKLSDGSGLQYRGPAVRGEARQTILEIVDQAQLNEHWPVHAERYGSGRGADNVKLTPPAIGTGLAIAVTYHSDNPPPGFPLTWSEP